MKVNFSSVMQPGGAPAQGTSFLPADYLQRKTETRANIVCLVLFGVVLFGVVGAFLVTHRAWNSVRDQQRGINAEYTEQTRKIEMLKQLESQQATMLDKAEVAATLNERVPRSILLAEIVNRMPERLTLNEVQLVSKRMVEAAPVKGAPQPNSIAGKAAAKPPVPPASLTKKPGGVGGGKDAAADAAARPKPAKMEYTITLTGFAASDEMVADYQRELKECALLDRVDLISSVASVVESVSLRKFRIEAMIRAEADARKIEPLRAPRLKSPASSAQAAAPAAKTGPAVAAVPAG